MKKSKRIHCLVILFLITVSHASVQAQDTLITDLRGTPVPGELLNLISIEFEEIPVIEALTEVANKGRFHLNYNESILPSGKRVSIRSTTRCVWSGGNCQRSV